jgi:diguanylate cyclase (GGDEF)-like protein
LILPSCGYGSKSAIKKKKVERDLKYLSLTDPLTGIYNRRFFFDSLMKQVEYKKRNSELKFSLAILDIDLFKSINDRFGHLAGDHVLVEFVTIIEENIRPYDLLARYGGEEFILLFFDCPKDSSLNILERIKQNLKENSFQYDSKKISFTFSCGVAEVDEVMDAERIADELIRLADSRLYTAKEGGRDRIIIEEV